MEWRDLMIRGAVQGVGFRPFVFRLAHELGIGGFVRNDPGGVFIHSAGPAEKLDSLIERLRKEAPSPAQVQSITVVNRGTTAELGPFLILASNAQGQPETIVMADLATCPACLREILDPANRRFQYPFTNCTHCGPRFSIIQGIPYDRASTTMRGFTLCPACRAEYENPADRRFHAQPNACPACGPQLTWRDSEGTFRGQGHDALQRASRALREGAIVAIKGIGGFHLMCDARSERAVAELRARKHREEKPFALMARDLEAARQLALISDDEALLLQSPAAPIVLLTRRVDAPVAPPVAPGNPALGIMLPYSPLHHLLLRKLDFPLVATSGNISDEPLCTDEHEALVRLRGLADFFLVHNRPIARPLDDSIARVIAGKPCILRRARGYAPLPIPLAHSLAQPVLAVGAHMKTSVTLAAGNRAVVGPHVGDLDTLEAREAFARAASDLPSLFATTPARWACDLHPDYASSIFAKQHESRVASVQHHHAHIASCMAEHGLTGPVFGIAWDGTGLGADETIWGGEFLRVDQHGFSRIASLRSFHLPGGDNAARKPLYSAFGVLREFMPDHMPTLAIQLLGITETEAHQWSTLIEKRVNAPRTSSIGRWFDAVAALTGICRASSFEGQAAMMLEWLARPDAPPYPFALQSGGEILSVDLQNTAQEIVADLQRNTPTGTISARFHQTLAEIAVAVAKRQELKQVALSGGCFQNRILAELCIARLREEGFTPYWQQLVPPNDGGISLGQAWVASYFL